MAQVITSEEFAAKIAEWVVLIDFFADWCGPCQALMPVIDELAEEYEGKAGIYKVNVDDSQELAMQFGVMSIPTLLVFKDGELVDKSMGAGSKEEIVEMLETHID